MGSSAGPGDVTRMLDRANAGDPAAADRLLALLYDELHDVAAAHLRRESPDPLLQTTALAHDAFMKMLGQNRVDWQGRAHFLALASQAMRRILVDHARTRSRQKRGGNGSPLSLNGDEFVTRRGENGGGLPGSSSRDLDLVALDEALEVLAAHDPVKARIVELKFFGGMTTEEMSHVLGISKRSVERGWEFARRWLHARLTFGDQARRCTGLETRATDDSGAGGHHTGRSPLE